MRKFSSSSGSSQKNVTNLTKWQRRRQKLKKNYRDTAKEEQRERQRGNRKKTAEGDATCN